MVSYPQKVDALTRILEVENFEGMIVFVRTKNETETLAEKLRARGFSATAINGDVAAGPARADRQPAQGGQARHPGRHRRRRPRPRRRADQPRRQLRHPDRHRVLRAPDRPHRPGRPQRRRDLVRDPARAVPAPVDREDHPPAADARCSCPRRGRQRHPAGALRRRDHRGAVGGGRGVVLPRRRRRTTCASTTCPRSTSPPRSPSCCRATRRCCSSRSRSGRRGDRVRTADDRGRARRPSRRGPRRSGRRPRAMATYRIAVGKRHKVEPRQIVGALANEGGLQPPRLRCDQHPPGLLARRAARRRCRPAPRRRCASTRISGKLIDLRVDQGRPQDRGAPTKKPRHKNR